MSLDLANNIACTLIDILRTHAHNRPAQHAFTFLMNGESEGIRVTYGELDRQARAIGSVLQRTTSVGERALLLYQPGPEYIAAFLGCVYAGVVAIPAYPPQSARPERPLARRLRTIALDCQASIVLTQSSFLPVFRKLAEQMVELKSIISIATDLVPVGSEMSWQEPAILGESLVFLQYTSGSTSEPKGVMLTHRNLLHNSSLIQRYFEHTSESKGVIWLPPYHDMGLIGGIIQPLYAGFPVTLMSPVAFLQRPLRWLEAISREHATTSGGPNFAYDLCVSKSTPEQRAELDLSSWKVAFTGAEPVRADTMARFADAFAVSGFRKTAFYPCYGLAEATLIVSASRVDTLPRVDSLDRDALQQHQAVVVPEQAEQAVSFVSNGQSSEEQRLVIVDPGTHVECPAGSVGEIWVSGPSIAQGYWSKPEATEETFQARLSTYPDHTFLRTGDLGFLSQDELFITGRIKDLIIIRGRNHYPQDIERTVELSHSALRPNYGAAFSIEVDGSEQLVVVQEVERHERNLDIEHVATLIRQAVAQQHDVQVYEIVFIKTGTILKTSSGKIQRSACRAQYLAGQLECVGQSKQEASEEKVVTDQYALTRDDIVGMSPAHAVETLATYLTSLFASIVHVAPDLLQHDQTLASLSIDSLAAIELQYHIERDLGVQLSPTAFLDEFSIAQLADELSQHIVSVETLAPVDALVNGEEGVAFPLSYGQRALWFVQQLDAHNTAYTIASAIRIRGRLDLDALQQAFHILCERHPALRTGFGMQTGVPYQYIRAQIASALHVEDIADWDDESLQKYLMQEVHRPFDLEQDLLFRVHVLQRSSTEAVLLLTIHHLIADFWSLAIMLQEVAAIYQAELSQGAISLAPVGMRYADFVHWQEQMLAGKRGQELKGYWLQQLASELPVLDLPYDYPRPAVQTYHGRGYAFLLSKELTQQVKSMAQANGLTLYMALLACWNMLLYRYSGQDDILVGSPLAGRGSARWADVFGYFVNPVVLRAHVSGDMPVNVFFVQVRRMVLDALAHQEYPFPLLVENLQADRDPSRSPLFQTMFVLEKSHLHDQNDVALSLANPYAASLQFAGLQADVLALEQLTSQFDLSLMLEEANNTLAVNVQYNTDLFARSTIVRMSQHFQALVNAATQNIDAMIGELPMFSQEEEEQFACWNATHLDYPTQEALYGGFERQVQRTPHACALIVGEQCISYQELNARANRLAHLLRAQGVGTEKRVAICLERRAELVIALLATLKAGGAYVPLDPKYPHERLAWMLGDAQPQVLLSQRVVLDHLPTETINCPVLCVDELEESLASQSEENLPHKIVPEQLAYVIYTSGSTGVPKGVAISHRNAVAFVAWARQAYRPEQLAGVLAGTSICFDLSIFELFAPLQRGGTIILVENALQLPELSAREQVTLLNTVPSVASELLRLGGWPSRLQTVNLAGEPLPRRLVEQLYQQGSVQEVYNLYGPSEGTTYSTGALIKAEDERVPSIGVPISNERVYVLDGNGQRVPVGVVGELYVGGAGVARGYLGRAEMTAERFVPDSWSGEPGTRMYRTGDLVRYRENGQLEFLGRRDSQVKVRGFRIELGEIEHALRQHAAVQDVVVDSYKDSAGISMLIAYIVPKTSGSFTPEDLRLHLLRTLPGYMIPSVFQMLDALPLSVNGKVDRRRLPRPDESRASQQTDYVAPQTPLEEIVANLWSGVLHVKPVGLHENFFTIGGTSLHLIQIVSRLQQIFQIALPLQQVMQAGTVQKTAELLIQHEKRAGQVEQTARILRKIQSMPAKDRENLLHTKRSSGRNN
jgi:amino acid adenylation domain-containing protein